MNHNTETGTNRLTRGQIAVLAAATLPMVAFGGLGGWGTYANIVSVFDRSATALGVVAAGEGATLVLALVAVGLVMLGQSVPAPVRVGLWALPAVASATGAAVAETVTEAVVFAVTPMAMTVSAEGMGLLARRIVVFRTGVDAEAQRRNAAVVQRLAYHRARAANHPSDHARKRSERASWRLARRVGVGDAQLGARLVGVQRERLTEGADAALAGMFGTIPTAAPEPTPETEDDLTVTFERAAADMPEVDAEPAPEVTAKPSPAAIPPAAVLPPNPLVICGGDRVWAPVVPSPATDQEVNTDTDEEVDTFGGVDRLSADAAANVIRACWVMGVSVGDAAQKATRSRSYVHKVYGRLDAMRTAEPAKREWPALTWPEVSA